MYDQVGCGASTAFPSKLHDAEFWKIEMFIAELENLISHFGIKQYDILGQSWGGLLAAEFALTQSKGLRKLINEGGPDSIPSYAAVSRKLRTQLPQDEQETLSRAEREGNFESEECKKAEYHYYAKHICRTSPWPQEIFDAFGQLERDPTVYFTMMGPNEFLATGTLRDWDVRGMLGEITASTVPGGLLLINGLHDTVQDECISAFFTKPSCRVKWVQFALSGHYVMLEETERFLKVVGEFLTAE